MYLKKIKNYIKRVFNFSILQGTSRHTEPCRRWLLSLPHYCVLSHKIVLLYNQECVSVNHQDSAACTSCTLRSRSSIQFRLVFRVGRSVVKFDPIESKESLTFSPMKLGDIL